MIRVALVDDHALLRHGTAALLSAGSDIEVVAEAGSGQAALEIARTLRPQVIVLDIRLPDISGIDVARTLRQELPEIKIIIVSAFQLEQYVRAAFAIGVHGYLLKSASGPELIAAVRAVQAGETVLSDEVAQHMANRTRRAGIAADPELSAREREVLGMVAQGASNKAIAVQLNLGVRTVETHVGNAMAKLGARSRIEAINLALQRGLIERDRASR